MQQYTYRTTDHNDRPIAGTYTIWRNGDNREIEYTYPDGDPARWTTVHVAKRHADGTPIFWKGHATLRPRQEDAIVDAIRDGVPPQRFSFGPMPMIAGLDDDEVAAIVAHVRALQAAAGID